jgi:hypothetical protein
MSHANKDSTVTIHRGISIPAGSVFRLRAKMPDTVAGPHRSFTCFPELPVKKCGINFKTCTNQVANLLCGYIVII